MSYRLKYCWEWFEAPPTRPCLLLQIYGVPSQKVPLLVPKVCDQNMCQPRSSILKSTWGKEIYSISGTKSADQSDRA